MTLYILYAIAGLLVWPLRGQFGGWSGGFLVGTLFGTLTSLAYPVRFASWHSRGLATLLCAIGFMWGGEISYGRQFAAMMAPNGSFIKPSDAVLQLTLMGMAWGGIGGLGLGWGLSEKKLSRTDLFFGLGMIIFWFLTIWVGFGRFIWIPFLIIVVSFLYYNHRTQQSQAAHILTWSVLIGTAIGFLLSSLLMWNAGQRFGGMLGEAFKLRDQVIGIATGIGMAWGFRHLHLPRSPKRNKRDEVSHLTWGYPLLPISLAISFLCCLHNVLRDWDLITWISPSTRWIGLIAAILLSIGYILFISMQEPNQRLIAGSFMIWVIGITTMAIFKEVWPGWPERWELGFSVLIVTLVIFEGLLFRFLRDLPATK